MLEKSAHMPTSYLPNAPSALLSPLRKYPSPVQGHPCTQAPHPSPFPSQAPCSLIIPCLALAISHPRYRAICI